MKKIIIAAAITMTTGLAQADQYNGIYGGVDYTSTKTISQTTSLGPTGSWETVGSVLDFNKTKDNIGAHIGYQQTINGQFLIGAEAAYIPNKSTTTIVSPTVAWHNDSYSTKDIYSLNARVGFVKDSWLFYAKGGVAETTLSINLVDTLFPANYYNQSKRTLGASFGGGIEYAFMENISIGIDYNEINWKTSSAVGEQVPLNDSFRISAKSKITSLRFNYMF